MATSTEIIINQDVLGNLPQGERVLVGEYYVPILQDMHRFYDVQKEQGHFPRGLSRQELFRAADLNPDLISPYTLVRREDGVLRAVPYIEREPYKGLLASMASRMEAAAQFAKEIKLPESDLIADSLRPRAHSLREGNFEAAMISHLNEDRLPAIDLFVGLNDRYLDTLASLKLVGEGWVLQGEEKLTEFYNNLIKIKRKAGKPKMKVVVGNSVISGGLAADQVWSGNTIPSEDNLRQRFGSICYIFWNNLERKFDSSLGQAMQEFAPQVALLKNWEEMAKKAFAIDLVMHEKGHANARLEEGAGEDIQENYAAIRELMAEVDGQASVLELPDHMLSRKMKEIVIYSSLVWWMKDALSLQQERGARRVVAGSYARAATMGLNFFTRSGAISINNNVILIPDLDKFRIKANGLLNQLEYNVADAKVKPSVMRAFVLINTTTPRDFRSPRINIQDQLIVS